MSFVKSYGPEIGFLSVILIVAIGLVLILWMTIDLFRPDATSSYQAESLFTLLIPAFPFLAGAWGSLACFYIIHATSAGKRRRALYGLAELFIILAVTTGMFIGGYIYFGGIAYTQWLLLIVQTLYIGAALDFGMVIVPVLLIRLLTTRTFLPSKVIIAS